MTVNLEEWSMRSTLQKVRSEGHPYVEIREEGDGLVFFCTLCLQPCWGEFLLFYHLNHEVHTNRRATAQVTLMKSNPWPFSDGVLFFREDSESRPSGDGISFDSDQDHSCTSPELVIPSLLLEYKVTDLVARHLGVAQIGARLTGKDGASNQVRRIWCEWLGRKLLATGGGTEMIAKHEFALVIFSYNDNLGRMRLLDDSEADDSCRSRGENRKSEDTSEALSNQCGSSGKDSQSSINSCSDIMLSGNNDQPSVYERSCDICGHRMLPNQDVAALVNVKTGKLVCSSRNSTGAFHLLHVSCLIHWILLFEIELCEKQSVVAKTTTKSKSTRNMKGKGAKLGKKHEMREKHIGSAYCPECQGTGITPEGEELEKPTISLKVISKYKIISWKAREAWMKNPEDLQNCSIGFSFPPLQSDEISEETVAPLKFLHFYRAVV